MRGLLCVKRRSRLASPRELALAEVLLDVVERCDATQPFAHAFEVSRLGLEDLPPRVCPALRVRDTDLLGIAGVGSVAVGQQHGD